MPMPESQCQDCPVKDIQKLRSLVEKKLTRGLPGDVREPLLEAKKQARRALRNLIAHLLEEEAPCGERKDQRSRPIRLE